MRINMGIIKATPVTPKLWKHQEHALEKIRAIDYRGILSMDMGTGKTLVAIRAMMEHVERRKLYFAGKIPPPIYLVVCPLSVVGVWRAEIAKWTGGEMMVCDYSRHGTKALTMAFASKHPSVVLINYEKFRTQGFVDNSKKVLRWSRYSGVIFDESHWIASHKTVQSRMAHDFVKELDRFFSWVKDDDADSPGPLVLCASGTVFSHTQLSLFGQMRVIDSGVFGTWTKFKSRYAETKVIPGAPVPIITGMKNTGELMEIFYQHAHCCRASDADVELPEILEQIYPFTMSTAAMRAYKSILKDMAAEFGNGKEIVLNNVLERMLRLIQICSGFVTQDGKMIERIDNNRRNHFSEILDMIYGSYPDEHVVVFYKYIEELEDLKHVAKKSCYRLTEINGSSRSGLDANGELAVEDRDDGDPVLCCVQVAAGSEGINLTRARHAVFYRRSQSFAQHAQALKRLHRPGQDKPVHVYHIEARDPKSQVELVDRAIRDTVEQRRSFMANAMKDYIKDIKDII